MKPHKLLDYLLANWYKNDAAIAKAWRVSPAVISRIRKGEIEIKAKYILAIYDSSDLTIEHIRQLIDKKDNHEGV